MERLEELAARVEEALQRAAEAENFGPIEAWLEPYKPSHGASLIACAEGFGALTLAGRHIRVRKWLTQGLRPEDERQVITILALTPDEADRLPDRLPSMAALVHWQGDGPA